MIENIIFLHIEIIYVQIYLLDLGGEQNINVKINSAFEIAKYVITICCLNKKPITNLELQVILYHLQLFYLEKTGNKLFYDEIGVKNYSIQIPFIDNLFISDDQMHIKSLYNCFDIDLEKKELIKPEIHRLISNNLHKLMK